MGSVRDHAMEEAEAQFGLMAHLAWRDYRHEWRMSGCFVLALSAVLIPLLVLFGLKYGIIANLLDPLVEDPRYREITPRGSGTYGAEWFEGMRGRADVAFVVPRTRSIAATMKIQVPDSDIGRIIDVELIPSAETDPVLPEDSPQPSGFDRAVLSADAADKLGIETGEAVEGILTRTRQDELESVRLPLEVAAIAPAGAFARDGAFVSVDFVVAVEDFLDGRAVPALGWEGTESREGPRSFAGFRLYARGLDDVANLRTQLLDQGIDVSTRVADIELVRTLDRNLSIVYWIIAVIAVSGYCLSFGASVWANVDRKRREFSVLRLTGFRTRGIVWFPILQAALTGFLAWGIACVAYWGVEGALNALFVSNVGGGENICRLLPSHLLVALGLTLLAAGIAATLGGLRIAQLEPSVGLRDD